MGSKLDPAAPVIPDLDVPAPKPRTSGSPAPRMSGSPSRPTVPAAPVHDARALDVGLDSDDWDMEIEREGAALASLTSAPPTGGRPSGAMRASSPSFHRVTPVASTGLEVAYDRRESFTREARASDVSPLTKVIAYVAALVLVFGGAFALTRIAHRAGGRPVESFLPHAFDATSALESGGVAATMLVLAIAMGTIGIMLRPRSWLLVTAAAPMLFMSLAMVTVTLTATEEHPSPPDGARLLPYLVPLSLLLLGLGVGARGGYRFTQPRARRALGLVACIFAGAFVFLAIETSALATLLH